jgi:hypothetical protein
MRMVAAGAALLLASSGLFLQTGVGGLSALLAATAALGTGLAVVRSLARRRPGRTSPPSGR